MNGYTIKQLQQLMRIGADYTSFKHPGLSGRVEDARLIPADSECAQTRIWRRVRFPAPNGETFTVEEYSVI